MEIYVETKKMTLGNEEHELVLKIKEEEFFGYDYCLDLDNDILSKNKEGEYIVREQESWFSYPLYEIVDRKIILFNYKDYQYFKNTNRRMSLGEKISNLYNIYSEMKLHRKTLKFIMDTLKIPYPDFFDKYNKKVDNVIKNNPKGGL